MKSILCIPGNWSDRTELVTSIVEKTNGEYIFAGGVLLNTKTNQSYELEVCDADEKMAQAFEVAGEVTGISDEELAIIEDHSFVLYLVGETGNFSAAREIAQAARALLKAGGTGVKVETAGKAFSAQLWAELIDNFDEENLYVLFVMDSIVDEEGSVYSCGMHNLGLRDTIVSGLDFEEAVDIISIFGYYQLLDNPTITENEIFSEDEEAPAYLILEEFEQPYEGDELFENPYGMWRLEPTEE